MLRATIAELAAAHGFDAITARVLRSLAAGDAVNAAQRVTALEQRVAQLEATVAALLRANGPRDREDLALLEQLLASTHGRLFTAHDLQRHAGVDSELAAALEDACLQSPGEIGAWLRGHKGEHHGVFVQRVGRQWRVTHGTHGSAADLLR